MPIDIPPRDPIGVERRKVIRERTLGDERECSRCGERRPEALIADSDPRVCAECQRIAHVKSPIERHHPAGRANDRLTVPILANDHRELSDAQYDWPRITLENSNGDPLLRAAGSLRGFVDTVVLLMRELLLWIAELLEGVSAYLVKTQGAAWWRGTALEGFSPNPPRRR